MICWLVLGTWLLPAFAHPAEQAEKKLRGSWAATKAERDGKAVDDVVGNRLVFTGNRFQIQSKDGKALYAGTFRVNPGAKPAAIDFEHTEGVFKGKTWKGIYRLDANTLTICDNAPEPNKGRGPPRSRQRVSLGTSSSRLSALILEAKHDDVNRRMQSMRRLLFHSIRRSL